MSKYEVEKVEQRKKELYSVTNYRKRLKLQTKINNYNKIRDKMNKDGKYTYNVVLRGVASICSKYYTRKWERWYD